MKNEHSNFLMSDLLILELKINERVVFFCYLISLFVENRLRKDQTRQTNDKRTMCQMKLTFTSIAFNSSK